MNRSAVFVKKSLKFKLVALSIFNVAILGLSSMEVIHYLVESQKSAKMENFETSARGLSDGIGAQFYERYGDIQTFAMNPSLQSQNRQVIIDTLNSYVSMYGIYDLILIVDSKGHLVASNSKSSDGKGIHTSPLYSVDYSNTPWFKAVMAGKFTEDKEKGFSGTYFEDVHLESNEVLGKKRIETSFSAPVKNARGEVVGVISTRAGTRWIEAAIRETYEGLKKAGYPHSLLSLMGKDGTLLFEYASDKGQDLKSDEDQVLTFNLVASGNEAAKRAMSGESGHRVQKNTRTGDLQVVGYGPIESDKFIDKIGWSVLVRDSTQEVFLNANRAQQRFYIFFSILLAVTSLISYFFAQRLSQNLGALASRLNVGSSEVSSAATSVSKSSGDLSDAIAKQASAIQETAASIDEVSSMVKKSADNASQSQKVSRSSRETAEMGQQSLQEMIQSIHEISQSSTAIMKQVEDGNRQISEIAKVIAEIGNKTKVINDIVFQTKLLSFNASVEAARAGEHGKGFAVVAEEVGNLAQMSGNAAKEISSMLDSSIQKVESIINETKAKVEHLVVDSRQKVDLGTKIAQKCNDSLSGILVAVRDVDGMVGEISTASNEQSQGISEINKAINQLDEATQKTSGVAQNAASSAVHLSSQAVQFQKVVEDLFSLINGNGGNGEYGPTKTQKDNPSQRVEANPSKVIPFSAKTKPQTAGSPIKTQKSVTLRKAVGAQSSPMIGKSVPSKDDARFVDI